MEHEIPDRPIIPPQLNQHNRHSKYIDTLSKITCNMNAVGAARIAACVVYKNNIIAFGTNRNKSHPFQVKFGKTAESIYLHAEIEAIKNALKVLSQKELSKSTLYICRTKYLDETKNKMIFGIAKPCPGCARAIATFNLKRVVYSLNNEGYDAL